MKRSILAAIVLSMLLAAGCSSQKSWVYAPSPFQDKPSLSIKKAVVQPFDDLR
jgi:PBP1b-binding outer membrane lipoprotein LpoB